MKRKLVQSVLFFLFFMSSVLAVDCGNPGSPAPVFWLNMNEATGGTGTTLDDVCGTNDFQRKTTTENVTGVWDGAQDYKLADKDYSYNYSTAAMGIGNTTATNRSARALYYMHSKTTYEFILEVGNNAHEIFQMITRNDGKGRCLCSYGTGVGSYEVVTSSAFALSNWYDIACVYDGSYLAIWVNGTLNASIATPSGCEGRNDTVLIGDYDGATGSYPADGYIDEVSYYNNYALNNTEISNLWLHDYLNPPGVGCYVTNLSPANSSTQITNIITFSGITTCYASPLNNCTLYINDVSNATNSTITNNTAFSLNVFVPSGTFSYWRYNCSSSTYFNSSAAWNLTLAASCANFDYALAAAFNWNYTGRNAAANNLTGVVACSNMTSPTDFWSYTSGRNLTSFGTLVADILAAIQGSTLVNDIVAAIQASTLVADIEAAIWGGPVRTLTDYNMTGVVACSNETSPADTWNYPNRTLSDFNASWATNLTAADFWVYPSRNLTFYNCTTTGNLTANCSVNVDGCTRPIVLKTGECS